MIVELIVGGVILVAGILIYKNTNVKEVVNSEVNTVKTDVNNDVNTVKSSIDSGLNQAKTDVNKI